MNTKLTRALALIDLECTGLDVASDRIVEIGVILLNPDGSRKKFGMRFNPGRPIPAEATAVHGITDADVKDCPSFDSWALKIHRALQDRDIGGYNLWRLDLPMLDEEFRRSGLKLDLTGVRVIDAYGIFAKKESRKLEDAVRKYCGREHTGAHGAVEDALATLDVLAGQLRAYPDLDEMSIDQLAEFSATDDRKYADLARKIYYGQDGFARFAFGKNKDQRVIDQRGYCDWMATKGNFPASTIEAMQVELAKHPA